MRKAKAWALTLEGSGGPEERMKDYRGQDVWEGAGQILLLSITIYI